MKRIVLAALAALVATAAFAADPPKPAGLDAARKTFVATVKAKDWVKLADQVNWPLKVDNYGSPPTLAKAAYLKDHKKLSIWLDDSLLGCIGGSAAAYQGDKTQFGFGNWIVDCNGNEFLFGVVGGKVLFTAYQNVNE